MTAMTNDDCSTVNIRKLDANQFLKESFQPKVPNTTYKQKIKLFCAWVDKENGLTTPNGKYTTRDNVDKLFLLNQRFRTNVQNENLTQMKDTIQFHADNNEHPPPIPKLVVESRIVKECTAEQQRNHVNNRLCKSKYSH